MEGWSSLVRCGSPYSTARVHGDTPCALAKLPRVPPPHIHIRREGCPRADWYRRGACGWLLRGARLDGVRHTHTDEAALWGPWYGAHRGGAVGSVALACGLLVKRQCLWRARPGQLPAQYVPIPGCLPGAHGVGLRAY